MLGEVILKQAMTFSILALSAMAAFGQNLVTNGTFNAGNSGFTSAYTYVAPAKNVLYAEGQYTVGNDTTFVHDQFKAVSGQGGAGDNFMMINGAVAGNADVWVSNSIAVVPNTNYFFEAFATNICCSGGTGSASKITFTVQGDATSASLSDFSTGDSAVGSWQLLSNIWNSGSNTSVTLRLVNASLQPAGNDFAIDTINFNTQSVTAVPEPATWALLIGGFGVVAAVARKRKAAAA